MQVFPNLYRNVIPAQPDQVWVGDLTYIRTVFGFAYLAALLDACSRKVVGYAISRRMDAELTLAALHAAYRNRRPAPGTCIHHTDRGCQYACRRYRQALANYGLIGSMSRVGNSYDNAQAESFMKTLKAEEIYLDRYETFADVAERLPRLSIMFTMPSACILHLVTCHPFNLRSNSPDRRLKNQIPDGPA